MGRQRQRPPTSSSRTSTATIPTASRRILTPYLGFTYDINETYTAYGSITSIYKPQLAQDIDRNYLDPTYGWNYELGVKAGLFGGAMYAAAAVFQTDQKDVAQYAGEAVGPRTARPTPTTS